MNELLLNPLFYLLVFSSLTIIIAVEITVLKLGDVLVAWLYLKLKIPPERRR